MKTGKSTVSKALGQKLDMVYIEAEELLESCLKRVLEWEQKEEEEGIGEGGEEEGDKKEEVDNVDLNVV